MNESLDLASSRSGSPARAPRTSFWAVVGLLGCVAVAGGFFLPWVTLTKEAREAFSLTREELKQVEAQVAADTDDARVAEAAKKLLANEPVGGPDWIAIAKWQMHKDGGPKSEQDRHAQDLLFWWLQATAFAAGGVAVLILLSRARALSAPVLALLVVVGALYGGPAAYGWYAATQRTAEDVAADKVTVGLGAQAVAAGGALMALAGLLGVSRRNWWKTYLLVLLLAAALLVVLGVYVGNAAK